jgi:hypothetical protein
VASRVDKIDDLTYLKRISLDTDINVFYKWNLPEDHNDKRANKILKNFILYSDWYTNWLYDIVDLRL